MDRIPFRQKADILGLGLNWGRPSAKTYGSQLRDQYTIEIYYRAQVFRHLAVTPDLQVLVRPADNPEVSAIAVVGARAPRLLRRTLTSRVSSTGSLC